jgi:glycerol-3-phosphate dehydrogenase
MHAEDIIARRTRLAFLNKAAAIEAIPVVVQIMGKELKWDKTRQKEEIVRCISYMKHFGGPDPADSPPKPQDK